MIKSMIRNGWLAGCLTGAILVSDTHLPDWRFTLTGLLVGLATWGLR
jgi:hypothetical protein